MTHIQYSISQHCITVNFIPFSSAKPFLQFYRILFSIEHPTSFSFFDPNQMARKIMVTTKFPKHYLHIQVKAFVRIEKKPITFTARITPFIEFSFWENSVFVTDFSTGIWMFMEFLIFCRRHIKRNGWNSISF